MVTCYRSGPIERDPSAAFHGKNQIDKFLRENNFTIIGDTFEILKSRGHPQAIYGSKMKKLRDLGKFYDYSREESLLIQSLKSASMADFVISKPAPEASGGTVSETLATCIRGVPKLVIIGPHGEGILDNDSTFMIRMLTDYYSLVFKSEKDVIDFIKVHIEAFKKGSDEIRKLFRAIKSSNPYVNDLPKLLWDDRFEGKTVLIQGKPGCGKDTQGRLLQNLCGFKFFGSGYELRRLFSKFPVLAESLGNGNLAPEIIIHYLMTASLIKLEKFEPIVFAGAAKKPAEANALMDLLTLLHRKLQVIVIDIDNDLMRERIVTRRNCDACETSFFGKKFVHNPTCPQCKGLLSFRPENASKATIDRILSWYKTDVEAVIRYFEGMGIVTHLNGNRSKKEIFDTIRQILVK